MTQEPKRRDVTNHYEYRCMECGKACGTVPEPTIDGLMGIASECCRAEVITRIVSSKDW